MAEWLPEGHLAWFVLDVVEQVDTSVFHRRHPRSGPGRRAYDPDMLLALLLYSYAVGQRSSRRIEALCETDVAFRVLCAQDGPDHTTIARFRSVHEDAFAEVFAQVLVLCASAGMGRVGVVSIDGSKIAANASLGANRGEEWLREQAAEQAGEQARAIVAEAAATDAAEDEEFGEGRGDELPREFADRSGRRERIRKALDEIGKQTKQAERDDADDRARAEEYLRRVEAGETVMGKPPAGTDPVRLHRARLARAKTRLAGAAAKTEAHNTARRQVRGAQRDLQAAEAAAAAGTVDLEGAAAKKRRRRGDPAPVANTSDPDSRMMSTRCGGFVQGYNAQLAVTDDHLILATALTQDANDYDAFEPMMNAARAATEAVDQLGGTGGIGVILADAGYLTEDNLTITGPDRLIATGKHHDVSRNARDHPAQGPPSPGASAIERMRHRLRTPEDHATYKRRSATVEPVIGHLKDQTGLRRFSRRGLTAAASELNLAAAVVNLLKLHNHTPQPAT
jgi:transposase